MNAWFIENPRFAHLQMVQRSSCRKFSQTPWPGNRSNQSGGHLINESFDLKLFHADSHPLLKSLFNVMVANERAENNDQKQRALVMMMNTAMSYHLHALDCQMKHTNPGCVILSWWMGLTIIIVNDSRICSPPHHLINAIQNHLIIQNALVH
jgi:hypothetical protein